MKSNKFIKIAIWFILFMAGLTISASMVSAANTVENLLGCVIFGFIVCVSIETKCLTTIKFRKHEK